MLPPRSRLRRPADVSCVRQKGQRWQHPLILLFVKIQSQEPRAATRFAFAVGRHVGKAARRNLVKRRLREIVRQHLEQLEPGYDCLLVARTAAALASYSELEEAVSQLLGRSGLIRQSLSCPEPGGLA